MSDKQVNNRLQSELKLRKENQQYRQIHLYEGHDFCSNDYLGLAAKTPDIDTYSAAGSTGSRLISGHHQSAEDFELLIAKAQGFENSLLFNSGYTANLGLIACLGKEGDLLLLDSLIHASSIDGARLSKATKSPFAHNDLSDLDAKLTSFNQTRTSESQQAFVIVESLYSMDGDYAPLNELSQLCKKYGANLIVDEAHALGIVGDHGCGLVSKLNLQKEVFATVYTFGKAMGCHGAVIASSNLLRDYLINYCRSFIYTTALSPQTISTLSQAYHQLQNADQQREVLNNNIAHLVDRIKTQTLANNMHWLDSQSPIQALMVGNNADAKKLQSKLTEEGFAIKAILSPTVPVGTERLRVCLHSSNTTQQIDHLIEIVSRFSSEIGLTN